MKQKIKEIKKRFDKWLSEEGNHILVVNSDEHEFRVRALK